MAISFSFGRLVRSDTVADAGVRQILQFWIGEADFRLEVAGEIGEMGEFE